MAENLVKILDENQADISAITGDTVVNIPLFGEITLDRLLGFLPLYIQLTKKKSVRDLIPKEIHDAIMAFAEASGTYEPPPKRYTLEQLEIPTAELAQMAHDMKKEGWSPIQIAKQLNLPQITVQRFFTDYADLRKTFLVKVKDNIRAWLKRKVELKLEKDLDRMLDLVPRGEEERKP